MHDTMEWVGLSGTLAAAQVSVQLLQDQPLSSLCDEELVDVLRQTERIRNMLAAVDHAQILEVERRGLATSSGARTVGRWLSLVLDLDPGEGRARHGAAEAAGARVSLTGEPVPPAHPVVAAAQSDGVLSPRQARVITNCVEKLPDAAKHEGPGIEQRLVGFATDLHLNPHQLAQAAQRELDWLDPDGSLHDVEHRARQRTFTLRRRADGSGTVAGEVTAELAEVLDVCFDSLAKPVKDDAGVDDPRTPGQRRHDALLDGLKMIIRSGDLPSAGGVAATIVVTMTAEQYEQRTGLARTSHDALVPVPVALRWGGGDSRVMAAVLDGVKGISHYGSCHRLFTETQRLAMAARDGGCSFPGCQAPPGWCEAHHVIAWQDDGPTSVDNGTLLCGYHHREHQRLGYTLDMINGRPRWTPPRWLRHGW